MLLHITPVYSLKVVCAVATVLQFLISMPAANELQFNRRAEPPKVRTHIHSKRYFYKISRFLTINLVNLSSQKGVENA
jgi:hypothetical protein